MSILNSLFGGKTDSPETITINWISLTNENQLENLTKTSVLFKHSTRCGISSSVLKRFEQQFGEIDDTVDFYFLDLLNFRNISNAIAEKFNVVHQSPQVVVVKNSELLAHGSHYDILGAGIENAIKQ